MPHTLAPSAPYFSDAQERLKNAGVQNPDKDIRLITDFVTKGSSPTSEDIHTILTLLKRRENREPLERILGQAEFFGLEFELSDSVFKPNFETETTAEYALLAAEELRRPVRILDLGTGTGCILISLLKKLPDAVGVGVDINPDSIALATRNALRHGVSERAAFRISDWTDDVHETFDIIVSNPPRVPKRLVSSLVREVAEFDPREALDGGEDGLLFYQRLADDFRRIANPDAVCIIQAGGIVISQAEKLFLARGFADVLVRRDYKYSPNCITFRCCEKESSVIPGIVGRFLKLFRPAE